jgi:integrator complex subunit 11
LQETIICKGVKLTPYYAGHVLGAGMFLVEYEGLSVLYTGDFNSYADRHLGAANAPRLDVNVVIT